MSLFLLTSLTLSACNQHPAFIGPPPALLEDCVARAFPLVVNADLVDGITSLRGDLKGCSAEKAGIRAWVADMKKAKAPRGK